MSRGLALFFGVALLCHGGVARAGDGGLFFQPLSVSSRCLGGVGKPGAVVKKWVDGAIDLDEGQLAFVSARPGTWLRASASGLRMGLAFGDRPASSAIVWAKGEGASAHLRVPIYSSAKWIVLGRKGSGEVNAEVAVSRHQPMRWFRFEEDFLDWVRRGGDPPAVRGAKAEHLIRMVDELQQALPYADREQMLEWLLQRLREQAMEGTRLRKPFYRRATVESSAARGAVARRGAMEIKAGAALELRPEPDSVLRLRLRASAGVETRVELRMGDALLRVFEWGGWEAGREDGWTRYARVHRVLYSAVATPFRLRVVRGKVRVAFDAAKRVSSLFELLGPGLQQYRGYPAEERSSLGLANALQRSGGLHTARVGAQRYANDSRQPAMARAFVAAELVHWARSVQEAVEAAEIALDPQLGLGATLQLRVLERLLALNAELSGPRCRAPPRPVAEGLALFARAMTGVLCGSDGGQRPADLATLAQVARGFPGQERLRKLARAAASASARWVAASTVTEVPNTVAWVEPSDGRADGLCRIQGTRHQRWTVLKPGRTAIDVGTPDESWNRIVTRAADYRDDWEGYLTVDAKPVAIHAAAGVASSFWVRPGSHGFELPRDAATLYARIPRQDLAPCADLRERHRWARVEDVASFSLPHAGAPTAVRVWLRAAHGRGLPSRLAVFVGRERFSTSVVRRGSEVALELPAGPHATELRLQTPGPPVLARVEIKLARPRLEPPLESSSAESAIAATRMDVDTALQTVREASRALSVLGDASKARGAPVPADKEAARDREAAKSWFSKRALALTSLGYDKLAALDRAAAGMPASTVPKRAGPTAARGPERTVLLGNVASQTPPCAVENPDLMLLARETLGRGEPEAALQLLRGKGSGADAETLLQAVLAEALGHSAVAADSWERMAVPLALARAARLRADASASTRDSELALGAFVTAMRAQQAGAEASGTVARVARAIRWVAPAAMGATAGSRFVQRDPVVGDSPSGASVPSRLRSAWVDAPEDAVLLWEDRMLRVSVQLDAPTVLRLEGDCAPFPWGSECQLMYETAGQERRPISPAGSQQRLAAGSHEVVMSTDGVGVAWVRIRTNRDPADLQIASSELWFRAAPSRDVRLTVAGPTVARLRLRGDPGVSSRAEVLVDDVVQRRVQLKGEEVLSLDIPVHPTGVHEVAVRTQERGVLSRIALATAHLPAELSSHHSRSVLRVQAGADSRAAMSVEAKESVPQEAAEPGPLTLVAYQRYVGADVRDEVDVVAGGAPYGELGVGAFRAFGEAPVYVEAIPFVRLRGGPTSYGLGATVETPTLGALPRFIASAAMIRQEALPAVMSWHGQLIGVWHVPVAEQLTLYPTLSGEGHWLGTVPLAVTDVDPDIYTEYRDEHPYALGLGLTAYGQPLVDVSYRVRPRMLFSPEPYTVDRAELLAEANLLPGKDLFPWVSLSYRIGYLPKNATRDNNLMRHRLSSFIFLWHWLSGSFRLSLATEASWHIALGAFAWTLELQQMWSPNRGVHDFRPRRVEHRHRLNEGSAISPYLTPSTTGGIGDE